MRLQHGDVFTFILLGKKTTVYVGPQGNEFILNGKQKDVNAEEIYNNLTGPVFGKDVVYDCPNAKLMEQKRVRKYSTERRASKWVPLTMIRDSSLRTFSRPRPSGATFL